MRDITKIVILELTGGALNKSQAQKLGWPMMGRMWSVLQSVNSEVEPELDELETNAKQFFLMAALTKGNSPGELARLMTVPPSTITYLVKQLEALGYVTRKIASADLRQVDLSLTAAGRRTVVKGEAIMNRAFGARLATLTKHELAQLDSILDKMMAPPQTRGPTTSHTKQPGARDRHA